MYINLEITISQIAKSNYKSTKQYVTKHISINQLANRITKLVKQKKQDYKKTINKKRVKQSININIKVFKQIDSKLIYIAIDIITKK